MGNQATVGLNRGNNSNFVPLPGDEDGTITSSQKNLLPIYSAEQNFLLFRAQGDSYSVMVVPEPGTYALFVSGTLPIAAAAAWRRRRKQAQQRGLK